MFLGLKMTLNSLKTRFFKKMLSMAKMASFRANFDFKYYNKLIQKRMCIQFLCLCFFYFYKSWFLVLYFVKMKNNQKKSKKHLFFKMFILLHISNKKRLITYVLSFCFILEQRYGDKKLVAKYQKTLFFRPWYTP